MTPPLTPSAPWNSDDLWMKAKLFINYTLDDEPGRSFDERALWASLSLELLGKAALSRASPLSIATPTEDGKNLLAAAGLTDEPGDVQDDRSVDDLQALRRCVQAVQRPGGRADRRGPQCICPLPR